MSGLDSANRISQLAEQANKKEIANQTGAKDFDKLSPEEKKDVTKVFSNSIRMGNKQSNPDAKPVAPIAVNSAIVYGDNKMDEYVNPLEDGNDSTVDEKGNNIITGGKSIDGKKIS